MLASNPSDRMNGLDFFFSSSSPSPPVVAGEEEDDWGDFVDSSPKPNGLSLDRGGTTDSTPARIESENKKNSQTQWVTPRGPVPLSVFGEAEEEEEDESGAPFNFSFDSFSEKHRNGSANTNPTVEISGVIANLYRENEPNDEINVNEKDPGVSFSWNPLNLDDTQRSTVVSDPTCSDLRNDDDDDFDDGWEFKTAESVLDPSSKENARNGSVVVVESTTDFDSSMWSSPTNGKQDDGDDDGPWGNGGWEFKVAETSETKESNGWGFGFGSENETTTTSYDSNFEKVLHKEENGSILFPSSTNVSPGGSSWAFNQPSLDTGKEKEEKEVQPDKPKGVLPLSFFEDEALETSDDLVHEDNLVSACDFSVREKTKAPSQTVSINDLISSLYSQVEEKNAANLSEKSATVNGEDDSWEFQGPTKTITDSSRLGLPNPDSVCRSCGSKDRKVCEGHFGVINLKYPVINPYFLKEIAALLNKICPGCKYMRKKQSQSSEDRPERCRYCTSNTGYPLMKFRVTTKEVFRRSGIVCEVSEDNLFKLSKRGLSSLPPDYWEFLPKDSNIDESCLKPSRRILTHAQVYALLCGIDERLIRKDIPMFDSLPLSSFPVTPNGHRVSEMVNQFTGARLVFDERTRIYKKLAGFEGNGLELSSRVIECMQYSRLFSENMSPSQESANPYQKKSDTPKLCGLRFMKDVLLGKRSDHTFRTVVVGDPSLKLNEIGIPRRISERLQVSENLNDWNRERLVTSCFHKLLERGETHVRRGGNLVAIRVIDDLQTGDSILRTLKDGDTVLMNRPPSIHQHSLIAMSVKLLPTTSVVSLNPICCLPFRGDFDGDCLHGYVPQSIQAKVELDELVALDKQLVNRQNGRNLLSLGQDSLTAAYLVNVETNCFLNRAQMQQLQMYCPFELPPPAIIKASPTSREPQWTGMQLFGMLFPPGFDYTYPLNDVVVSNGELLSSSDGSAWLRDGEGNFIQGLLKDHKEKVLDIMYSVQEMFSQLNRGLSVSLADLYLASDPQARRNLTEEIKYGLQEAEQVCNKQQLMVESYRDFLAGIVEEEEDLVADLDRFCYDRQRSATLSKLAVSAFKDAYRDVQALAYRYGDQSNSFLIMSKAGSKGNMGKLAQHSMCVGLQNSSVALSFGFPRKLTCASWNDPNSPLRGAKRQDETAAHESFVPFGVIENSFLTGLNPLESFVHSVTSRDSSFSGNADIPGALNRKLMFFMRDIYAAYDGTVRNSFGNHLVQFRYETADEDITGEAVGSLSACALTEAAYSALDQPISLLETSPLLNLKNVLECGSKKGLKEQTMSLYLSETLSKKKHGFEYGALDIKNHLEKLCFSEIVSTSMIIFSPRSNTKMPMSSWVCHFHISKKVLKQKQLDLESVVSSLNKQYANRKKELKLDVIDLEIQSTNHCSWDDKSMDGDRLCITVTVVEASTQDSLELEAIRLVLIPFLLDSPVKGYRDIKKVEILWVDRPKAPKKHMEGELLLKVTMHGVRGKKNIWSALLETCLPIMDMIDWTRSHPDNIRQCCSVYGIDAGRSIFLADLESAVSDTGKAMLREHLLLVADCLSVTGEFVALNPKGWSKQRQAEPTPAPFTQACFSSPSQCFLKAAKEGVTDELQGSIDALAWGKVPSFGTGDQFEIIISPKNHGFSSTPVDVYDFLSKTATLPKRKAVRATSSLLKSDKFTVQSFPSLDTALSKAVKTLDGKGLTRSQLRMIFTWDDIEKLSRSLKRILYNYEIDAPLNERDGRLLMMALLFHPNRDEKIGPGFQGIKVANSKHGNARCFEVVRTDGTTEDFSYHKCVLGATEIIAPKRVNFYKAKYLRKGAGQAGTI